MSDDTLPSMNDHADALHPVPGQPGPLKTQPNRQMDPVTAGEQQADRGYKWYGNVKDLQQGNAAADKARTSRKLPEPKVWIGPPNPKAY